MKKRESYSQATFEANISRMVISRTKKQAIEKAAYELNKSNIPLHRMTLKNEKGESKDFHVNHVELLEWHDAEFTDACHQFKVLGRIRLAISPQQAAIDHYETERGIYRLPQTTVYEKPVLVISEGLDHYFLTVLHQEMQWEPVLVKGINPLSKLA